MAFLFLRPISSHDAVGLALAAALVVAVPFADAVAQTKAPTSTERAPAEIAAAPGGGQDSNKPGSSDAKSGDSMPSKVTEDQQERNSRLVLLRLLVLGGGSYRPLGLFR